MRERPARAWQRAHSVASRPGTGALAPSCELGSSRTLHAATHASIDRQISISIDEHDSGEALAICAAREHPAGTCVEDATVYPRASDAPPPAAAGAVRADQSAWHTRHMRRMRM